MRGLEERVESLEQAVTLVEASEASAKIPVTYSRDPALLEVPELVLHPASPFPVSDERIPELETWSVADELPVSLRVQLQA